MFIREFMEPCKSTFSQNKKGRRTEANLLAFFDYAIPEILTAWWKKFDRETYDFLYGLLRAG
jgi:hypothetical protein